MTDEPQPTPSSEPEAPLPAPPPDESPFDTPPLEPAKKGDERPGEQRDRVDADQGHSGVVDPDESPFETPAIEGMPYERGSEEDLAIRRVIDG